MDYEEYEKECKRIKRENRKLISGFKKWLSAKGLSKTTIEKHAQNVDFYINDFLLYSDAVEAKDGATHIGMFLGFWFIKKALWSSASAIKENAVSLKKFYQFMYERGDTSKEDFDELKQMIKEQMPLWLATMARYEDPNIEDMDEVWGM